MVGCWTKTPGVANSNPSGGNFFQQEYFGPNYFNIPLAVSNQLVVQSEVLFIWEQNGNDVMNVVRYEKFLVHTQYTRTLIYYV